jgi:hypothetical protein
MLNSLFAPLKMADCGSSDVIANFQGKQFSPVKGVNTDCDFKVDDDNLLDGGRLIVTNSLVGDSVDAHIVDIDNIMGYGANTILRTFVSSWPVAPGTTVWDFSAAYPAKIKGGLYIRIVYKSVAAESDTAPVVAIGYKLHKVLW